MHCWHFSRDSPQTTLFRRYFQSSPVAFCRCISEFTFGFFSFLFRKHVSSFSLSQNKPCALTLFPVFPSMYVFRMQLGQGFCSSAITNAQGISASLLIKLLFPLLTKSLRIRLCQCCPDNCLHFYPWDQSTSLSPRRLENIYCSSAFPRALSLLTALISTCILPAPPPVLLPRHRCLCWLQSTFPPYASSVPNVIQMPWIPFQGDPGSIIASL